MRNGSSPLLSNSCQILEKKGQDFKVKITGTARKLQVYGDFNQMFDFSTDGKFLFSSSGQNGEDGEDGYSGRDGKEGYSGKDGYNGSYNPSGPGKI